MRLAGSMDQTRDLQVPARDWSSLPSCVLSHVLQSVVQDHETGSSSDIACARLVCQNWRLCLDHARTDIAPERWPTSRGNVLSRSFPHLNTVNLGRLSYGAGSLTEGGWCKGAGCSSDGGMRQCCGAPSSRILETPRSGAAAFVTPAATLKLWDDLPRLFQLRSLTLNGCMLPIVSTSSKSSKVFDWGQVDIPEEELLASKCLTYTYTLQLPAEIAKLTSLRTLNIQWYIPAQEVVIRCQESDSLCSYCHSTHPFSSPCPATAHTDSDTPTSSSLELAGNTPFAPGEPRASSSSSRSFEIVPYEPLKSLVIRHAADPAICLPPHLAALTNLKELRLAGDILGEQGLSSVSHLSHLTHLALEAGELNLHAIINLGPQLLGGLQQLELSQRGSWQLEQLVAIFGLTTRLEALTIEELEPRRAFGPEEVLPELPLAAADLAPLGHMLTSLTWRTCSWRLQSGTGLLPANGAAPWLAALTSCRKLSLEGSEGSVAGAAVLDALDESLLACKQLEELRVSGLGVPQLPQALGQQLQQLSRVTIRTCGLVRRGVAEDAEAALAPLGRCKGLRELSLVGCDLRALPEWLPGLSQLLLLQLQSNAVQELPSGPGLGLPLGLTHLNLAENRLRSLPREVRSLTALRVLCLNNNYLTSLPRRVWRLPQLEVLSVSQNMLSELPEVPLEEGPDRSSSSSSSFSSSSSMSRAGSSASSISSISSISVQGGNDGSSVTGVSGFGNFGEALCYDEDEVEVEVVEAAAPEPPALPAATSSSVSEAPRGPKPTCCGSLRVLIAERNQITRLPASLSNLRVLRVLHLGSNHLRSCPEPCLSGLKALEVLGLQDNHLAKLPHCLVDLQRLRLLNLGGNHLLDPPRWMRSLPGAVDVEDQTAALGGHKCALKLLLFGLRELVLTMKDAKSVAAMKRAKGMRALKARLRGAGQGARGDLLMSSLGHRVEVAGFKIPVH